MFRILQLFDENLREKRGGRGSESWVCGREREGGPRACPEQAAAEGLND